MSRSLSWLFVAGAWALTSSSAFAQGTADAAAKLNEEGKEQMYARNYPAATAKFRQAVALVGEAKYFFNLCTSLFQEGKYGEAMTACRAVEKNSPTPELQDKSNKLQDKIRAVVKEQLNVDIDKVQGNTDPKLDPGGGGIRDCAANPDDPNCRAVTPPPTGCQANPSAPECQPVRPPPQQQIVGRPPPNQALFVATKPDNKYVWTIGGEIIGGGGQIGRPDFYGQAAFGFRIKGDYLFQPAARLGSQVYLQYQDFTESQAQSFATHLTTMDLGIAAYKHLCPPNTERLCLTPLIGAHIAFMSPEGDQFGNTKQFNYAAVGGRAEIGLQWALGPRLEHVISVSLGANLYTGAFSGPAPEDGLASIEEVALDQGGVVGYFGIGYTHRFSTPIGSRPIFTLE